MTTFEFDIADLFSFTPAPSLHRPETCRPSKGAPFMTYPGHLSDQKKAIRCISRTMPDEVSLILYNPTEPWPRHNRLDACQYNQRANIPLSPSCSASFFVEPCHVNSHFAPKKNKSNARKRSGDNENAILWTPVLTPFAQMDTFGPKGLGFLLYEGGLKGT